MYALYTSATVLYILTVIVSILIVTSFLFHQLSFFLSSIWDATSIVFALYFPVPIGLLFLSEFDISSSPKTLLDIIGNVRLYSKSGFSSNRCIFIKLFATISTLSIFDTLALYIELFPRFFIVSIVNFTSSDEKVSSLCHLTPSLNLTRYVLLSVFENSVPKEFYSLK